jgi:hypothetical protein
MLQGKQEAKEDKVMDAEEGSIIEDDGSEEWEDIEDRADEEAIPSDP